MLRQVMDENDQAGRLRAGEIRRPKERSPGRGRSGALVQKCYHDSGWSWCCTVMQHARFAQQPRVWNRSGVTFLPKSERCRIKIARPARRFVRHDRSASLAGSGPQPKNQPFATAFWISRWSVFEYKIWAAPPFVGESDGPFAVRNCRRDGAQSAVRRDVGERSIGPRAGNLLAGAGALRHAASLPKALRGLHGDRLLDRDAGAKVWLREALSRPRIEAASSAW